MLTHRAATILGDVPSDWGRAQLESLLVEHSAGDWGDDSGERAVRVLRSTNFTARGTLDFSEVATRWFPARKVERMGLRMHDLLLERSGGGPTQPVGRVGFVQEHFPEHWFSNFVQLLRADPNRIDPSFLGWLLLQLHQSGVVERLQHQTTQMRNLDYRDYLRVFLPRPPRPEQRAISRILSLAGELRLAAEERLDAAQCLRTALMQHLFTHGVPGGDRRRPLKLARVFRHEFTVPEEWEVGPLRGSVTSVDYGTNAASNDQRRGLPVVAIPEVIASRFRLGDCSYAEVPTAEAGALRLTPDDVLLVRTNGNAEYIGKSTVIGQEAAQRHIIFASYLIRIRTNGEKLSGRYLNYFLASPLGRRQCLAMANTSAGNHNLGSRAIKQFCFPRPSRGEQDEIVHLVDAAEDSVETAQQKVVAVDRLRTALLQNLLTGQVRLEIGGDGTSDLDVPSLGINPGSVRVMAP